MRTRRVNTIGLATSEVILWLVACLAGTAGVHGEQVGEPSSQASGENPLIQLQFPENAPLKTLIAYVSARLNLNILYDDKDVEHQITLKVSSPIPQSGLLSLFHVVLRSNGLALQDTDLPQLKRIVPAGELAASSRLVRAGRGVDEARGESGGSETGGQPGRAGLDGAQTRVFRIERARVERVSELVRPFLTAPGGSVEALGDQSIVIVTDFTSNLERIAELIELIDSPGEQAVVRRVSVPEGNAKQLLELVEPVLNGSSQAAGGKGGVSGGNGVTVTIDPRTNQLIVVGPTGRAEGVVELIHSFVSKQEMDRRVYRPRVISPDRLDGVIRKVLDPEVVKNSYRGAVDASAGLLVVTAPGQIHLQIESLLKDMDTTPAKEEERVRFYKLTNTLAADVLATIRALEGSPGGSGGGELRGDEGGQKEASEQASAEGQAGASKEAAASNSTGASAALGYLGGKETGKSEGAKRDASGGGFKSGRSGVVIAADENTNSIIVVAPPAQQRHYEQIIKKLDERRPQVMIETSIVSLDTSDGFSLGVEIGVNGGVDKGTIFSFSSFGLSKVDGKTGRLDPTPGMGGNFALLTPEIADVVVRALSTSSRARLVSMPRVLVNDNELGSLQSVAREPYASINASNTVSTTSLGGYAEAGTTIGVRPHISSGDYLQLEYSVELSSFTLTGQRDASLPPPSQQNKVQSRVTIPDSHTIVVGGLNRVDYRQTVDAVPILGRIPGLEHLFSSRSTDTTNTTLFVFIRPVILRDDRFRDLKYLSSLDVVEAGVSGDYPESKPLLIEPAL